MSDRHPIPEPEGPRTNLGRRLEIEEYYVGEWCPTPDATGPATQVHVEIKVRGVEPRLVMRFKHPGELDRFIAVLARHRMGVWPQGPDA